MPVIARASLAEYFKDQVEGALAQRQVPASDDTAHYVVTLLTDTLRHDDASRAAALLDGRPLALRLAEALDQRCPAPGRALRDVADAALLLGGYFAPRAGERALPPAYYHRLGGFAYGALGKEPVVLGPVFRDIAERFSQYAEALDEVGRRAEMQTPAGVVRALELWARSRDRVTERLLVERGVVVSGSRRLSVQ